MSVFTSKVVVERPVSVVYDFLADLNNHRQLMPDNITDWSSTFNTASFNVENMASLSLKVESRADNEKIVIIPAEKPPFDLELTWELSSVNDVTEVVFNISADLNITLKMLASGPLQKLADHQTQTLGSLLS